VFGREGAQEGEPVRVTAMCVWDSDLDTDVLWELAQDGREEDDGNDSKPWGMEGMEELIR